LSGRPGSWPSPELAGVVVWLSILVAGTLFVRWCLAVIGWAWTVGR
jgi:hypothetical protein